MMGLDFNDLEALTCGRIGIVDVPCPLCGPSRDSPRNQRRETLRLWAEKDFIGYNCARCTARGWARPDRGAPIDYQRVARFNRKVAQRDQAYSKRQLDKASYLWAQSECPQATLVETYLREARGYSGPLPASLRFLPPKRPDHHPAMIARFGSSVETELTGVHLTLLRADGSDKAGTDRDKLMVGRSTGSPIVLTPINDLLGLIICEGIEDGLSLYDATGCGVWAAGSASRLHALADVVPPYIDCVTIAADDDDVGRVEANKLDELLRLRGMHVEMRLPTVTRRVA